MCTWDGIQSDDCLKSFGANVNVKPSLPCVRGLCVPALSPPEQPRLGPSDRPAHQQAAPAYLVRSPTAREEVPVVIAVKGDVQDIRVIVEGLLGPVSVVNVLKERGERTQCRQTPPAGPGGSGAEVTEGRGPSCVPVGHELTNCTTLDGWLTGTKAPAG